MAKSLYESLGVSKNASADELKKAYRDLNTRLVLERKDVELTFGFAAASALLLLASALLSLLWFGRTQ